MVYLVISPTRCHMWVKYAVGSWSCSEGYSLISQVYLPPPESILPNSNWIGNPRATGLSVKHCYMQPSFCKAKSFILFISLFSIINQDSLTLQRMVHVN